MPRLRPSSTCDLYQNGHLVKINGGMSSKFFLNDCHTPIITGITFDFTFHMRCISIKIIIILSAETLLVSERYTAVALTKIYP